MDKVLKRMGFDQMSSDIGIALGILFVLSVMIVPIPPFLLDFFLTSTLSLSVMVLLVAVYTKRPLDFSTFPTLLLVSTLFRLSLNVASTRNILLRGGSDGPGAAGEIIRSFGEFVVEGNFVVGIIVFTILVIINFMVVTKGAGRVSEVAARFTLDAMPGKQMAIDADLNAGLINDKEAKERRKEVAEEADFYGAMDGASKFVRGDAIAGILITIVNILGGIVVGVAQNGMSISQATELFTLLTVGDGLVTQIPALIISTAAGIISTRNTSEEGLGKQIAKQIKFHPKVLYIAAAVLAIIAMVPGFPRLPFFSIGALLFFAARRVEKQAAAGEIQAQLQEAKETEAKAESLEDLLDLELVELEVGYGLVNLVDPEQNGDLLERITHIRKQFALDWGVIVPSVRIKDNLELRPGDYRILIKGIQVAGGELMTDHFMAMDPGTVIEKIEGSETKEPVFNLPAVWITEEQKDDASYNGYTVVDLSTVIATHLSEILKAHLHELLGRQELSTLLEKFKGNHPKVVSDLIPDILSMGVVLKVIQNLLRENVSIRDMRTILETLSDYGAHTKNPETLTEKVREALFRTISKSVQSEQGDVPLFVLDRSIEEALSANIVETDEGRLAGLDAKTTQSILASVNEKIEEATEQGEKMIILCSPAVRSVFKKMTEKFIPGLTVIAHNELGPEISIRSLGTVRL